MEIFGGFMVMMSIISLFLAVVWLIMPFVVFAIKGKQDRAVELLEGIDKRLAILESRIPAMVPAAVSMTEPPLQQQPEVPEVCKSVSSPLAELDASPFLKGD